MMSPCRVDCSHCEAVTKMINIVMIRPGNGCLWDAIALDSSQCRKAADCSRLAPRRAPFDMAWRRSTIGTPRPSSPDRPSSRRGWTPFGWTYGRGWPSRASWRRPARPAVPDLCVRRHYLFAQTVRADVFAVFHVHGWIAAAALFLAHAPCHSFLAGAESIARRAVHEAGLRLSAAALRTQAETLPGIPPEF